MICLTLDTDWVPEEILSHAINILTGKQVKATIFATGYYDCLSKVNENLIEIGIHPNIQQLDQAEQTLITLQTIYPEAVSLRNHSLVHSSRFWAVYQKWGIKYTSNFLMPDQSHLTPVTILGAVTESPIYFIDDYYLGKPEITFTLDDLGLDRPGLKVFAFHPIHIYLNSSSMEDYNWAKPYLKDVQALAGYRNTKRKGIGQLFSALVDHLSTISESAYRLRDLTV